MSLLVVTPELLASAAANLESIGAAVNAGNLAAAVPTTALVAAGADEVSAAVAALFAGHAQEYQALSAQASAFHQQFVQALSSGAGGLGGWLYGDNRAAGVGSPVSATVPLYTFDNYPVVNVSVNGGPSVPVLVDTGSAGPVIPFFDIGFQHLGLPTGFDVIQYANGVDILYAKFNATVNFGSGAVTAPTPVLVGLLPFPTSPQGLGLILAGGAFGPGTAGILGIGPNTGAFAASGSGTVVTTALPGQLNEGELINQPQGYLQLGPNPLPPVASVTGVPFTTLDVQIGGYDPLGPYWSVTSVLDSGGNHGTIPGSILGTGQTSGPVPEGTIISISTNHNQTPLYSYTTTATNSPIVTGPVSMNTGFTPFTLGPVYIGNTPSGVGTIAFDY